MRWHRSLVANGHCVSGCDTSFATNGQRRLISPLLAPRTHTLTFPFLLVPSNGLRVSAQEWTLVVRSSCELSQMQLGVPGKTAACSKKRPRRKPRGVALSAPGSSAYEPVEPRSSGASHNTARAALAWSCCAASYDRLMPFSPVCKSPATFRS